MDPKHVLVGTCEVSHRLGVEVEVVGPGSKKCYVLVIYVFSERYPEVAVKMPREEIGQLFD